MTSTSAISPPQTSSVRFKSFWSCVRPYFALAFIMCVFYAPHILDNVQANSDVAIIGLQAMHMLHGEWAYKLWGTSYQGSFYPAIMALIFSVTGPSSIVIVVGSMVALIAGSCLIYATLRVCLDERTAFLATLPAALIAPSDWLFTFHPRAWASLIVILSIWGAVKASQSKTPNGWLLLSMLLYGFSLFVDLYCAFFAAGYAVLILGVIFVSDADNRLKMQRFASAIAGAALGLIPLYLADRATTSFAPPPLQSLADLWKLLVTVCIPAAFGFSSVAFKHSALIPIWNSGLVVFLRGISAAFFVGLMVGWIVGIRNRKAPVIAYLLGAMGLAASLETIFLFLHFGIPITLGSTRYLIPILVMSPFCIAPSAFEFDKKIFSSVTGGFVLVCIFTAWINNSPYELFGRDSFASIAQDRSIEQFLNSRGIKYCYSDYWTAYRMTFESRERVIIMPLEGKLDRYRKYRDQAKQENATGILVKGSEAYADGEISALKSFFASHEVPYKMGHVPGYTLLIVEKRGQSAN